MAILEGRPSRFTRLTGNHATDPDAVRATLEAAGFRRLASADLVRWSSLQTFVPAEAGIRPPTERLDTAATCPRIRCDLPTYAPWHHPVWTTAMSKRIQHLDARSKLR